MIFWSMWPNTNVKLIFRGAQSCKLACASVALFSLSSTFAGWADPTSSIPHLCLLLQSHIGVLFAPLPGIAALTSYRTNLSPFTKGCRDRGALMRLTQFLDANPASASCTVFPSSGSIFCCKRTLTYFPHLPQTSLRKGQ